MSEIHFDFTGRKAFVTGAGGGIGHRIVCDLLSAGCGVTALDIKVNPANFPAGPGELTYIQADIRDIDAVGAAFAAEPTGQLDFAVNAAGIALMQDDGSVVDINMDVWERTLQINLEGSVNVVRHAVPRMLQSGGGALVHIASIAGARSMDNALDAGPLDAYQVSKAALISLSKGLALTYGRHGIRSNTVCPGAIWTPMTDAIYQNEDRIAAMERRTPLQQLGKPEDVSKACLFLLSDNAAFITGTDLVVDGGLMAKLS